jgi:hypothetical protein
VHHSAPARRGSGRSHTTVALAAVIAHDRAGVRVWLRRRGSRRRGCNHRYTAGRRRRSARPLSLPMTWDEVAIAQAVANPDETFALGSKDPDVRSLLVEAVDRQIGAVFEQIDPRVVLSK